MRAKSADTDSFYMFTQKCTVTLSQHWGAVAQNSLEVRNSSSTPTAQSLLPVFQVLHNQSNLEFISFLSGSWSSSMASRERFYCHLLIWLVWQHCNCCFTLSFGLRLIWILCGQEVSFKWMSEKPCIKQNFLNVWTRPESSLLSNVLSFCLLLSPWTQTGSIR